MKKILVLAVALCFLALYGCKKHNVEAHASKNIINDMQVIHDVDFIKIKDANKGKILIVNYFASWCPPCQAETPDLVKVYNDYKDKNFTILGISTDDDKESAIKFVNKYGINYPVYLSDRDIERKYMVSAYPTSFVYDKTGKLIDIIEGMTNEDVLKQVAQLGTK